MSADDRSNGRKTLLPEFLPAPESASAEAKSPPERVGALARLLLRRFRGLGTTAGAAVLSLQCGGYAVVDPMPPPPMQCTIESPPFASLHTVAGYRNGSAADRSIILTIESNSYPPASFTGYSIDAVRVRGGTLVNIQNVIPNGAFHYDIRIDDAMLDVLVDVDLSCGANATTKHYRITVNANPNALTVEEITPVDGGTAGDAGTD